MGSYVVELGMESGFQHGVTLSRCLWKSLYQILYKGSARSCHVGMRSPAGAKTFIKASKWDGAAMP